MPQIKNITNVTSAVAATLGIDALSGWTFVAATTEDLPAGSVSSGFLAQTSDAVAATLKICTNAEVFAGLVTDGDSFPSGTADGRKTYHHEKLRVRWVKTDNNVGVVPTEATLLTIRQSRSGGTNPRFTVVARHSSPISSPDLTDFDMVMGGLNISVNSPSGVSGSEGAFNHTASGRVYKPQSGVVTSPSGGIYNPNMPYGVWMDLDVIYDYANKRGYLLIGGHMYGFYSFDSADTAQGPTIDWTFTFPAWTGFRAHVERMAAWGEPNDGWVNDPWLVAYDDASNWKTWSAPPTFGEVIGKLVCPGMRFATLVNFTRTCIPRSLGTGNTPGREAMTLTGTSASLGTGTFALANLPMRYGEYGHCAVGTMLRLGGADATSTPSKSWVFTGQFSGITPSFQIAYSSGAYRLTDAAGKELGNWQPNELVEWILIIKQSGEVRSVIINQSRDTTAAGATFSGIASLASSDIAPSSMFSFIGTFQATSDGSAVINAEMEQWDAGPRRVILQTDSYVEAPLTGTAIAINIGSVTGTPVANEIITEVSTGSTLRYISHGGGVLHGARVSGTPGGTGTYNFAGGASCTGSGINAYYDNANFVNASRSSINVPSWQTGAVSQMDCNAHGAMCLPQGPHMPRIALNTVMGRSGRRGSALYANNFANGQLDAAEGLWGLLWFGFANDVLQVTDATSAATIAALIDTSYTAMARHYLDRYGGFIWVRPVYPPERPNLSHPIAGLNTIWPRTCFYTARTALSNSLALLQRTHARGKNIVVVDVGNPNFDEGLHVGIAGTIASATVAWAQIAHALGLSYANGSVGVAAPGQLNVAANSNSVLVRNRNW